MANLSKTELKVIREAFEGEAGHELRLTDDAISKIVMIDKDKFMEADLEDQVAQLLKAEDVFKGIAIADPSITGLINKMDEPFNTELEACINAVVKNKTTAIDIFAQFKRVYAKATLDALPYPGTDKDDVKGTNFRPDIIEKPAVAGGTIRTVFTHDWVQATKLGKQYQDDIDTAKNEEKNPGSTKFKGKSKKELKAITSSATQGRNAMRSMFGRALALHHKLSAISEMSWVKFEWIEGTKDKCVELPTEYQGNTTQRVTLAPKPFWFMPVNKETGKEKGSDGRDFSVTQVLAFDPAKAQRMPDGGTLAELVATAKAEPVTPESLGEKMTHETMDTEFVVLNAKLSNTEERAALRKRMVEKDNETLRESICALYLNLKGAYEANKKWYDERINGKSDDAAAA